MLHSAPTSNKGQRVAGTLCAHYMLSLPNDRHFFTCPLEPPHRAPPTMPPITNKPLTNLKNNKMAPMNIFVYININVKGKFDKTYDFKYDT